MQLVLCVNFNLETEKKLILLIWSVNFVVFMINLRLADAPKPELHLKIN